MTDGIAAYHKKKGGLLMADITMCGNDDCPRRKQCYRATAKPGVMQSWCEFPVKDYETCEYCIQDDKANAFKHDEVE